MPIEILMPALSPTMEEGKLAAWMVKEGDAVTSGMVLAEIETDKATMEVEAIDDGRIGRILIEAGAEGVKVNTPIAILLEDGEDEAAMSAPAAAPAATPPSTAPAAGNDSAAASSTPAETPSAAPPPASAPQQTQNATGDRIFISPLARRLAVEAGFD
ncbi:MAG: biotin/lipoyl-containing protein, partial [Hyphomicrobiaceae bacterium]